MSQFKKAHTSNNKSMSVREDYMVVTLYSMLNINSLLNFPYFTNLKTKIGLIWHSLVAKLHFNNKNVIL